MFNVTSPNTPKQLSSNYQLSGFLSLSEYDINHFSFPFNNYTISLTYTRKV
jgi:hypothetical protein